MAAGSLTGDVRGGVSRSFVYDRAGRMVSVQAGGVTIASYAYDAFEQRVSKTTTAAAPGGASNVHFVHDQYGRLIAEHNGATGAVLREYVWLGLVPVVYVDHSSGLALAYYVLADQVGEPQKLTDAAGALVWDRRATPFGEEVSVTGTLTQALRFPGQRHDAETLLADNWHRTFDPSLGRYIQSDPIGLLGGINTYAYVGGNPVTAFDPLGLDSLRFNGSSLNAYDDDGNLSKSWPAVSGSPKSCQCRDDQGEEGFGPIPEGDYSVDPAKTNRRRPWKRNWGPRRSWGDVRTPIDPSPGNKIAGRAGGFYMHGGDEPGSAGCVDLTSQNEDFHRWLSGQDEPVPLSVRYPRDPAWSKGDL